MITAKERSVQFMNELKALLKKWDAEIELEDVGKNWMPDRVIKCYIGGVYEDGKCTAEFTEIDLGTNIYPY